MTGSASPLAHSILAALESMASSSRDAGAGVSLPRLGKHLGQGASVLLRELSTMGSAVMAGRAGPGWVRVEQCDGRWLVHLTDAGRAILNGVSELPHQEGPAA